ncbi:acyl-CoA dehydrogenase family protein [Chloroflexota bacterium]
MDFKCTEEQERFRKKVQDFLEQEIKQGLWQPSSDGWAMGYDPAFSKRVAAKGWIGLAWPKEYGGQGCSWMDRLILTEEMLRYGAPAACHWFGDRQVGGAIVVHGTEEQKRTILPKIMRGEAFVGLGLSEPEAGSDLGNLKIRAIEEGDYFVINGQKVWTTGARFLNYIYLLAKTDPGAPRGKGISEFFFESNLPGITMHPLLDITGHEAWNEVFFDNVRVPKTALIGKKGSGFFQVLGQLDYERSGMERLMGNYPLLEAIIKFVKETKRNGKPLAEIPLIRDRVAQLRVEFEIGRLLIYRVAVVMDQGKAPTVEAAMAKTYSTAFEQKLAMAAIETVGLYGQLQPKSKWVPFNGLAYHSYLVSKGYSLQAGTSEILKNVLAQRGLGLPAQ